MKSTWALAALSFFAISTLATASSTPLSIPGLFVYDAGRSSNLPKFDEDCARVLVETMDTLYEDLAPGSSSETLDAMANEFIAAKVKTYGKALSLGEEATVKEFHDEWHSARGIRKKVYHHIQKHLGQWVPEKLFEYTYKIIFDRNGKIRGLEFEDVQLFLDFFSDPEMSAFFKSLRLDTLKLDFTEGPQQEVLNSIIPIFEILEKNAREGALKNLEMNIRDTIDEESYGVSDWIANALVKSPALLSKLEHLGFFAADFSRSEVFNNEVLPKLKLSSLELALSVVSLQTLQTIAGMQSIRHLSLHAPRMLHAPLAKMIGKMKQLISLNIAGHRFETEDLREIAQLPELTWLNFDPFQELAAYHTPQDIEILALGLPKLKHAILGDMWGTDFKQMLMPLAQHSSHLRSVAVRAKTRAPWLRKMRPEVEIVNYNSGGGENLIWQILSPGF